MFVIYRGQSVPLTGALQWHRDEVAELSHMNPPVRVLVVRMIDDMTREMFSLRVESFEHAEYILEQFACYKRKPDGTQDADMTFRSWDWAVEHIHSFLGSLKRDPNPHCGAPAPTMALEA